MFDQSRFSIARTALVFTLLTSIGSARFPLIRYQHLESSVVFHQRTSLGASEQLDVHPVLSDDGTTIAYMVREWDGDDDDYVTYAMDFDGGNVTEVHRFDQARGLTHIHISGDGQRIIVTDHDRVQVVDRSGALVARLADTNGRVAGVRIVKEAGSGHYVAYFLISRDSWDRLRNLTLPRGLYKIDLDAQTLLVVVTAHGVAPMFGVNAEDLFFDPTNYLGSFDVSGDGRRAVVMLSGGARVVSVETGSGAMDVVFDNQSWPRCINSVSMDYDGGRIGYRQDLPLSHYEFGVINPDGTNKSVLVQDAPGAESSDEVNIKGDGSAVFCGSSGLLAYTDGSGFSYPPAMGGRWSKDNLMIYGAMLRGGMDSNGRRFVYLWKTQPGGVVQLATAEFTTNHDGAPGFCHIEVTPSTVVRPEASWSTVRAKVLSPGTLARVNCVALYGLAPNAGRVDPYVFKGVMLDNGKQNDGAAGDGVFGFSLCAAQAQAQLGLHAIRVNAETTDFQGRRHGASAVISPFMVVASAAPELDSISPEAALPGDTITIQGRNFGTGGQPNGVKIDNEWATILSESGTEIVAAVPAGLAAGYAPVFVSARGDLSNMGMLQVLGAPDQFALSPEQMTLGAGSGTAAINVTAEAGDSWTARSTADWIRVVGGASGSGNGTVTIEVERNASTLPRTGALVIAGQEYQVDQQGVVLPQPVVRIAAQTGAGQSIRLRIPAEPGIYYQIKKSVDTGLENFQNFGVPMAGDGGMLEIDDPIMLGGRAFYRLVAEPGF